MSIYAKLKELGIVLPQAVLPVANYLPCKLVGNMLYLSGQLPFEDGKINIKGKVTEANLEEAKRASKICVIQALSQVNALFNPSQNDSSGVDRISACHRLGVFVNSEGSFDKHSVVANGASDFIAELLGDAGKHVRCAVGMSSLPLDASVEVEFLFEVR